MAKMYSPLFYYFYFVSAGSKFAVFYILKILFFNMIFIYFFVKYPIFAKNKHKKILEILQGFYKAMLQTVETYCFMFIVWK